VSKPIDTYYLAESYSSNQHTASIVRKDNEKILAAKGFAALKFRYVKQGSFIVKLQRLNELAKLVLSVKKNSLVVFHFPLLAHAYGILLKMLGKKEVKTVAVIIDIDGLRYRDENVLKKEIAILKQFTCIIAHNSAMKSFLEQYIAADKISTIELFDYPAKQAIPERSLSNVVCFAGNFDKAGFVNKLDTVQQVRFNLYGPSFNADHKNNIAYKGSFAPHELPQKLDGSFGLVWDGDSVETCDDYLQYNNPHKLSLYIAAALPVIVWEKSAVAALVLKKNIGITVSSLQELDNKIKSIPGAAYQQMKQNIEPLRQRLIKGSFLQTAIAALNME
jgi:hypothetical protein